MESETSDEIKSDCTPQERGNVNEGLPSEVQALQSRKRKIIRNIFVFLVLTVAASSLIGYYHAQKKYTTPSYLYAVAASRITLVEADGEFHLS